MTNAANISSPDNTIQHPAADYRFEHFSLPLVLRDMRFSSDSRPVGDFLPNAELVSVDGTVTDLRSLAAQRPLVLITGSISCPLTVSSLPVLRRLEEQHREQFNFAYLYTREAHPGANYEQPHTLEAKRNHAVEFQKSYDVSWPVLVDDVDGTLHRLLDAKPNSVHIVSGDGRVLFRALFASDAKLAGALRDIADGNGPSKQQGTSLMGPTLTSVGYIYDVLRRSGRGALKDVVTAAPPMAMMGIAANAFPWVSKGKRGLAVMAAATALALGGLAVWLF